MCKSCMYKKLFLGYGIIMLFLLFDRQGPDIGAADFFYWEWVSSHLRLQPFGTTCSFLRLLLTPQEYLSWMEPEAYRASCWHAVKNLVGNVALFIPLGFFPPLLWDTCRKLWKTVALAATIMTIVELTQVLTLRGQCDIDDVILNTLGAAIGYSLFHLANINRTQTSSR